MLTQNFGRNETVLKIVLVVMLVMLFSVVVATVFFMRKSDSYSTKIDSGSERKSMEVPVKKEEPSLEQSLRGSLVSIDEEHSYFRISVKGESIYSISLPVSAKIIMNGKQVSMTDLKPFMEIDVQAIALPDTDSYDFSAQTVDVVDSTKTLEQKMNEMKGFSSAN